MIIRANSAAALDDTESVQTLVGGPILARGTREHDVSIQSLRRNLGTNRVADAAPTVLRRRNVGSPRGHRPDIETLAQQAATSPAT
jgi:hypothetical protein